MELEVSSRGVASVLFFALVFGPPWLDQKYNPPLSPVVRELILTTCHDAKEWAAIGFGTEYILPALLSTSMQTAALLYLDAIRNVQDWASFWYWYYVEDVAMEDPCIGWNVRGRLRLFRAFLLIISRSLFSKFETWRKSRYVLTEQVFCGAENSKRVFIHTPLQTSHFRLLRLHARPSQYGLLKGSLFTIPLEDPTSTNTSYKCLSYRWGSEDKSHVILVNNCSFYVSQSLWEFLNVYRGRSDNDSYLWIDQICINQADVREKSYQVSQMDTIYKQCKEVIVWLGRCSDSSSGRALHFLHAIQSRRGAAFKSHASFGHCFCPDDSKCMIKGSSPQHNLEPHPALQALLSNPYWSRAWIVQEIILAPRAKIVCGPYSIDYVVEKESLLLRSHSRERCWFPQDTQQFFDLMYTHAQIQLRDPLHTQRLWRLQDAILFVRGEARDVRNKVFALQGLVMPEQRIRIDYTITKEKLFQEVLIVLFSH
jgi:hypothetical protein